MTRCAHDGRGATAVARYRSSAGDLRRGLVCCAALVLIVVGAGTSAGAAAGGVATSLDASPGGDSVGSRVVPGDGRPAAVAPVTGAVVRGFDPPETSYGRGHRGVDLAAAPGEEVRAALSGVVRFAGPVAGRRWITLEHADGLSTTYGGLEPRVEQGDRVMLGDRIGRATDQGWIDWGARYRHVYIDPLGLLGGWVARLVE